MTSRRWRNTVKDAESDTAANIESDHYPVKALIRIKLKASKKGGQTRKRYRECRDEARGNVNETTTKRRKENKEQEEKEEKTEEREEGEREEKKREANRRRL